MNTDQEKLSGIKKDIFKIFVSCTKVFLDEITDDDEYKMEILRHAFEVNILLGAGVILTNNEKNAELRDLLITVCNCLHYKLEESKPKNCKELFYCLTADFRN